LLKVAVVLIDLTAYVLLSGADYTAVNDQAFKKDYPAA
jgi:hypothetical protein